MTRALLSLALVLTAAFAGLLLLLAGQPISASQELRDLLNARLCEMPCWLGIVPGESETDETLLTLKRHPWVGDVASYLYPDAVLGSIYWAWNGQQPEWIDARQNGVILIRQDRVERLSFRTRVPFGMVMLLLNRPQYGILINRAQTNTYYHYAAYHDGRLEIRSLPACPMHRYSLWQTTVEVTLRDKPANFTQPYDLVGWVESPVC